MKRSYRFRYVAVAFLLLTGCATSKEQLSPSVTSLPAAGQIDVRVLQQQFLAKNYASQLVFPLTDHSSISLAPR